MIIVVMVGVDYPQREPTSPDRRLPISRQRVTRNAMACDLQLSESQWRLDQETALCK
jgi:hypothetical protein